MEILSSEGDVQSRIKRERFGVLWGHHMILFLKSEFYKLNLIGRKLLHDK
jgi:hypothetical protein